MTLIKSYTKSDLGRDGDMRIYHHGEFMVVINYSEDNFEAWLARLNYGIMELMFGMPASQQTRDEFFQLVEYNLDEYMAIYDERHGWDNV